MNDCYGTYNLQGNKRVQLFIDFSGTLYDYTILMA